MTEQTQWNSMLNDLNAEHVKIVTAVVSPNTIQSVMTCQKCFGGWDKTCVSENYFQISRHTDTWRVHCVSWRWTPPASGSYLFESAFSFSENILVIFCHFIFDAMNCVRIDRFSGKSRKIPYELLIAISTSVIGRWNSLSSSDFVVFVSVDDNNCSCLDSNCVTNNRAQRYVVDTVVVVAVAVIITHFDL